MRIIITILMGFFLMGCDEEAIQSYLDSLPKEDQEDIARIAPEIIDDAAAALKKFIAGYEGDWSFKGTDGSCVNDVTSLAPYPLDQDLVFGERPQDLKPGLYENTVIDTDMTVVLAPTNQAGKQSSLYYQDAGGDMTAVNVALVGSDTMIVEFKDCAYSVYERVKK